VVKNHLMKQQNIIWVFLKTIKQVENKLLLDKAKASVTHKICITQVNLDQVLRWTRPKKAQRLEVAFLEEKD